MARRPQTSLVPAFESEWLSAIAIAMGRRRKAIRHGWVERFAMERDTDSEGEERFNIHVCARVTSSTSVRLRVWRDGIMWFSAAQPGPSRRGGWRLMLSFFGDVSSFEPEELVKTFEASLGGLGGQIDAGEATPKLLGVWRRAAPEIERDDHAG